MNGDYRKERLLWHNLKKFDKRDIKTFGVSEVFAAGIEIKMYNAFGHPVNLFIAANALNESGLFYEKDDGKSAARLFGEKDNFFAMLIRNLLNQAGDITYNMEEYKNLPKVPEINFVNFFTLGKCGKFYKNLTYDEIHCKEHPYYYFYVYARELLNEIRRREWVRLKEKRAVLQIGKSLNSDSKKNIIYE